MPTSERPEIAQTKALARLVLASPRLHVFLDQLAKADPTDPNAFQRVLARWLKAEQDPLRQKTPA